jgi:hypothetical protein
VNTLQERLRDLYVSHGISHIQEAADRIDADAERIKALEADAERLDWLEASATHHGFCHSHYDQYRY